MAEPKKQILPHMYVISPVPTGGYLITLGDPRDTASRTIRGPIDADEVKWWVDQNVDRCISDNHVIDISRGKRKFGISETWTEPHACLIAEISARKLP